MFVSVDSNMCIVLLHYAQEIKHLQAIRGVFFELLRGFFRAASGRCLRGDRSKAPPEPPFRAKRTVLCTAGTPADR